MIKRVNVKLYSHTVVSNCIRIQFVKSRDYKEKIISPGRELNQ